MTYAVVGSDRDHDYVVRPGETRYGVNFDGVALIGTGADDATTLDDIVTERCTASLITDRHLLSAAHCVDENEDGVIDTDIRDFLFVAGFELTGRDVLIRIDAEAIHLRPSWPNDEVDIAVLELLESAPTEIPRYPLYGWHDEIGKRVVIAGYGATGFGDSGIDLEASELFTKRVGVNRFDDVLDDRRLELGYDFDSGHQDHNTFEFFGVESDVGFGPDEVLGAKGDSGGPVFIDGSIAGVSAFGAWLLETDFNDEFDNSWGEVGFNTRVSRLRDFLEEVTNGQTVFHPMLGDFDESGGLDHVDIDMLMVAVLEENPAPRFDINDDSVLSRADLRSWLAELKGTYVGDANLDGEFDTGDLVQVFQAGEYEDAIANNSTWATGDWNANGDFTSSDLVNAFQDGGFEQGPRESIRAAPEPSPVTTVLIGLIPVLVASRRARR